MKNASETVQDVRFFSYYYSYCKCYQKSATRCISLQVKPPGTTQSLLDWFEAAGIRVCCLARDKKRFSFAKAFRQPVRPIRPHIQ